MAHRRPQHPRDPMADLDNPLIFHTARQFGELHGPHAHDYALKLATTARKRGNTKRHEFWKCVKAALGSRQK
jgi:hypothetical protein